MNGCAARVRSWPPAPPRKGQNEAVRITAEAERVKGQILSFANAEATKIRSEGLKDAGTRYATFADNTELAVFLRQVDTMKKMLPGSTLVLDANALEFLNLIRTPVLDGADGASASEGAE